MTAVAGTDYVDASSVTVHTFNVPAGVTAGMQALFLCGTSDGTVRTVTWSTSGAGTFSAVDAQVCTNTYVTIAKGSGFAAGDTITATSATATLMTIGHYYDDTIASYGAPAAAVATVNQAAQVSGSLTPAAGQRVRVIQVNRNTSANSLVSVTSSAGETVTTLNYQDVLSGPTVNTLFAEYTATAATARTATVTMSLATNHNTYVAQIPIAAVPPAVVGGLPAGLKVEVEFTPGTWTDVTADVDAQTGIQLKFGRTSEFSAPQVATCNLTLDDSLGKYTALNASSPYYPNIRPRRRIRVSNTYGPRFVGYIKGWPPGFDGNRRIVHITASDRMSLLARRTLSDAISEELALFPPSFYFPMDDSGSSTVATGLRLAEWRQACSPRIFQTIGTLPNGTVAGGVAPQTGPWDTNWVRFTPQGAPGLGNGTSWVAILATDPSATNPLVFGDTWMFSLAFRNIDLTYTTAQFLWYQPDTTGNYLMVQYQYTGAGPAQMGLEFNDNTNHSRLLNWTIPADTLPHVVRVAAGDTVAHSGVNVYIDGVNVATGAYVANPQPTGSNGVTPANQASVGQNCYMDIAHLGIWQGASTITGSLAPAILTGFTGELSGSTVDRICAYAGVGVSESFTDPGVAVMGSYPQSGKTVDTALADVATTEGGGSVVFVDTGGLVTFRDRTYRNATTPAMTVDAVLDLDGTNFVPAFDELTLVNSSAVTDNATGTVMVYTDAVSVAEFQQTTDQATSYAADDQQALNLAQDRVSRQSEPALRVSQLAVDLFTATGTATYAALAGVTIGSRVRVTNLPTTVTGPTGSVVCFPLGQMDSYVEGWSETIAIDSYMVVFDTSPADNPPRMLWSDPVYGRWQADPGSMTLSAGVTAAATSVSVATAGSSPRITTSAGDLPFLVVIDTEVMQVTAVGGASSPQALTVTRAQNGTLATAHTAGALVNVYPTAAWTL